MFLNIFKIAGLCIVFGAASIPMSFTVSTDPWIVWVGNALGSLISAFVVIYVGNRINNKKFQEKVSKRRVGKKIVTVFEQGDDNKSVKKATIMINKHGLRIFAFFSPIFPGVLIATVVVYVLDLDKRMYKRWLFPGIFAASWFYVFSYWWAFVK